MEQNQTQDEVQRERAQREKLGREKDVLTGEVFTIRQQLQVRCVCVCARVSHSPHRLDRPSYSADWGHGCQYL